MSRESKMMDVAIKIAEATTPFSCARVGAVLAIKSEIIAVGFNSNKKHTFAQKYQRHEKAVYFHAETMCIYMASKKMEIEDFAKATLYIARIKQNIHKEEVTGLAKPCSGCQGAIKAFNIKKVYYTLDNNKGFELFSN